jgi:hypothetical protein
MSEPLRAHEPEGPAPIGAGDGNASPPDAIPGPRTAVPDDPTLAELVQRAREHAEAEAAVDAVMRGEEEKSAKREAQENRHKHPAPLRLVLLCTLLLFNAYTWFGHPEWLEFHAPSRPSLDYYEGSWKLAVYLQRQRIEEYRKVKGRLPASAQQAGPTVKGVQYTPLEMRTYQLAAGDGAKQFVYRSTDSLSAQLGRSLFQMGLVTGGAR